MARPTNEQRVLIAQRRTRVLAMRVEQRPYEDIAAELGVSIDVARQDYKRAREEARRELVTVVTHARELELVKLDAMEREAWRVLRTRHITVQQGKIVGKFAGFAVIPDTDEVYYGADGKPIPLFDEIEDDAPVLQAIDRLERISRRRAALLGLDAPVRLEVSAEVDAEITAFAAALASGVGDLEPAGEAEAPGDAEAG